MLKRRISSSRAATVVALAAVVALAVTVTPSLAKQAQSFLTTKWQLSTIPGVAVIITALGLSLIGDGLADLLRPE